MLDHRALLEKMVLLALQENVAHQVLLVHKDPQVNQVLLARLDHRVK